MIPLLPLLVITTSNPSILVPINALLQPAVTPRSTAICHRHRCLPASRRFQQQQQRTFLQRYSSSSSSSSNNERGSSDLTTTRVPLERIFNGGREYLFTTRRNIRNFEWGIEEVEELFESVLDLIDGDNDSDNSDDDDDAYDTRGYSPLELNAITIMPTSTVTTETHRNKGKTANLGRSSQLFDVHDGQQRLVSICLIFAALRDNFLEWGEEWEEDAMEISQAIYPKKSRLEDVARMQMKERRVESVMHRILSNEWIDDHDTNGLDEDSGPKSRLFYKNYLKHYTVKERKSMPKSELYILEAYEYLIDRVKELKPRRAIKFLDALKDDTFLLVCIPSSTRMARSIVMGLGKGKNLEPVDEFKGLVCFCSIRDEALQDEVLNKWDALCEDVGRDTLSSACILIAQSELQKPVMKNNGEVDLFEDYLKIYLESITKGDGDGATYFKNVLVPATKILQSLHDGTLVLEGNGDKTPPSLSFLRAACQIRTSKDIELVILHLLSHYEKGKTKSQKGEIEDALFDLEGIALWMMLTKPKPAERRKRCFDIINLRSSRPKGRKKVDKYYNPLSLSSEERHAIIDNLENGEFGKGMDSKIGKAILERLNEHELITSSQVKKIQYMHSTLQIEHILPQKYNKVAKWIEEWNEDDAELWMHRLGNLVLLNQKLNSKISNGHFVEKIKHYKSSPYPMTRRISDSYLEKWTLDEVKDNHFYVLDFAKCVWELAV